MKTYRVLLIVLVLAAAAIACRLDWWNVTPSTVSEHATLVAERTATAYEATASYGGERLRVVLTAIAGTEGVP